MFGLFKKKIKEEDNSDLELERLEKELKESKDELQDIFSYVERHHDQKSNKISLKPQDYKNYYEHVADPVEKTEVMVLEYIGELEEKERFNSFNWEYEGLTEGLCIYKISKTTKYNKEDNFSLDDISSALLKNETITGDPSSDNEFGILIVPYLIPINNLGFNRDLKKTETDLVVEKFCKEAEFGFGYLKDELEFLEKEGTKYHKYFLGYKSEIELVEKGNLKKRSRRISQKVKDDVWRRDDGKCVECGSNEKLEFDHIIPFSKGGANTYRNIQLLCESCNRSKSDKIG